MEAYKHMAEQEQGFKVTDRRSSMATEPEQAQDEAAQEAEAQDDASQSDMAQSDASQKAKAQASPESTTQAPPPETDQNIPFPEANLVTLIFSLYTHTQICLGLLPDPVTQQPQKDLSQAQYNIDLLTVLKEKTQGNLTSEEEQTLESILYEVRMAYVGAKNQS
jgi:hypothetical protein